MTTYLHYGIITQGIPCVISFFAKKITFINLMTAIDSTNDQNTICRVI